MSVTQLDLQLSQCSSVHILRRCAIARYKYCASHDIAISSPSRSRSSLSPPPPSHVDHHGISPPKPYEPLAAPRGRSRVAVSFLAATSRGGRVSVPLLAATRRGGRIGVLNLACTRVGGRVGSLLRGERRAAHRAPQP